MKQYWRRPFQFWTDFKRSVEAEAIPEPAWYRCVMKNPPGQYNILGRKPWRQLKFPLDQYRKLYYSDYPSESMLYAHSALPGESKYRKTPMDIFMDRHSELVDQGLDGDLAYLQCQEEKDAREFTQHLERYFCAQQAVNFYGVEIETPEPPRGGLSAYEKARNSVMKEHRDRLASIIRMKRDAGGENARVVREDLEGITNEELLEYVRLYPDDAGAFDESVFLTEEEEEGEFGGIAPPTYEWANEQTVHSHFGIGDYWDPLKYEDKDIRTVTNADLEMIQADTVKMIDHLSEQMGLSTESESLYDTLSDTGRQEVLHIWTSMMPASRELASQRYHSSTMARHLSEYQDTVTNHVANAGFTPTQRRDSKVMENALNQPFADYSESVNKTRSARAKRVDPLKVASSRSRSQGKL